MKQLSKRVWAILIAVIMAIAPFFTAGVTVYADPDSQVVQEAKIELTITNNTGMFNAVSASLETADGKTTLVMALNGTGYKKLFKGTYEDAVKAGDGIKDAWIEGYENAEGKLEFRIPIAEGETYVPCVAISESYYNKYVSGQNSLARAFYPRQFEINAEAKTLVTGDYEFTKDLEVTNNVKMLSVDGAKMETVGGPNSNNYKGNLILTMGSTSYTAAFVGNCAEAKAAATDKTIALNTDDKTFTIPVKWVETFGKPETTKSLANGEKFYLSLYSAKNSDWYERVATLDEAAGTLVLDPSVADYTDVDAAIAQFNALTEANYTEESYAAAKAAVEAVVTGKFENQQAEVDAMAAAIQEALAGLVELPADYTALGTAMEKAQALDKDRYTEESCAVLEAAMAKYRIGMTITKQAEVDALAQEIEDAIAALVKKPVPEIAEGMYKLPELAAGPSAMFNHFIDTSKVLIVTGDKAIIRFITDGSTDSIQKYSRIALGKSSELLTENYQPDSALPEGTVIIDGILQESDDETSKYLFDIEISKEEAEEIIHYGDPFYITIWNKEGSKADKIPGWYKAGNDIYLTLGALGGETFIPADYTKLGEALEKAEALKEKEDIYTEESFAALEAAMAKYAVGMPITKQAEVDAIAQEIEEAIAALTVLPADYTALGAALEKAQALNKAWYTEESFAVLEAAMAKFRMGILITQQAEVDAIAEEIEEAIKALKMVSADYSAVRAAFEKAEALDLNLYTTESAAIVQKAVESVDLELLADQQDKVDAMAKALEDAIAGLKLKNGVIKDGGQWKYFENGKFKAVTGVVKRPSDGNWFYVKKGIVKRYNGIAVRLTDNAQVYVENGKFTKVTGLVPHTNGSWYYVEKGVRSYKEGIVKHYKNDKWYYVKNGKLNRATGVATRLADGKELYVEKGVFNAKKTDLVKRLSDKKSVYVKNGVFQNKVTGGVKRLSDKKWYYVEKGVFKKATGLAKQVGTNNYIYFKNGTFTKFTGKAKVIGGTKTYNVKNGKLVK